ncbi:hypothetical protein JHK84_054755 [Glycine max]|nr:hypothetical protein JHK84_054755 [Glycine max]
MVKLGWSLCGKRNSLWVQILRKKYKCGDSIVPNVNVLQPGSNTWRGICHNWENVTANLEWRIGDGNSVNFWNQLWVPSQDPLAHKSTCVVLSDLEAESNSNASIQAQSGSAFVGVILRDHCGFVVVSCVVDIGICPVVSAESWVVCIGVLIA